MGPPRKNHFNTAVIARPEGQQDSRRSMILRHGSRRKFIDVPLIQCFKSGKKMLPECHLWNMRHTQRYWNRYVMRI